MLTLHFFIFHVQDNFQPTQTPAVINRAETNVNLKDAGPPDDHIKLDLP